ncbi:MAG: methyltransferase [Pseudonocardiales bacterium]
MEASEELRRLINGFQISQALHVAAELGLSDLMATGPRTVTELAEQTGTHEPSLFRLLRALASIGVYEQHQDAHFANSELGEALRIDAPGSPGGWARLVGSRYQWQAWGALEHSVRTGENAFTSIEGMSIWEFRQRHPQEGAVFDAAMTSLTARVADAVVDAYDFGAHKTLVDVGGGHGWLLATILARTPSLHGVLFDQPTVVADAAPTLADAGVSSRCRVVGGDFFDTVPAGADAYLLKSIIHDWPDDESVAILRVCRSAMAPNGVLLLVERVLDEGPERAGTAFSDLNMLVLPGGQERTVEEYRTLLATAGLRLAGVTPAGQSFVLSAAPE